MNTQYQAIETERQAIPYKRSLPDGEIRGVVLGVHGFASSKDSPTQRAVADAGVRQNLAVICFDFPAHGESSFGAGRSLNVPFRFYEDLQNRPVMQQTWDRPVLIVHGDQDEVVPYEDVVRFCSAHPTAELCTLYGAGHEFTEDGMNAAMRYAIQFWSSGTVHKP